MDQMMLIPHEPEMIRAFRDTWQLGVHSYLSHIRERVLLSKELLDETGSLFFQISDDNLHHCREIIDEIFGPENYFGTICFQKPLHLYLRKTFCLQKWILLSGMLK